MNDINTNPPKAPVALGLSDEQKQAILDQFPDRKASKDRYKPILVLSIIEIIAGLLQLPFNEIIHNTYTTAAQGMIIIVSLNTIVWLGVLKLSNFARLLSIGLAWLSLVATIYELSALFGSVTAAQLGNASPVAIGLLFLPIITSLLVIFILGRQSTKDLFL